MDESVEQLIPPTITLLVTAFASLLIGVYLEKFKRKLSFLRYKLLFSSLGTTTQDSYWGDIKVLHNGNEIRHLNFVTIEIRNDSNRDFRDMHIDVWVDQNSEILGTGGNFKEGQNAIFLEDNYSEKFNELVKRNLADVAAKDQNPNHLTPPDLLHEIKWVLTNKKFHLPAFNRRTSIELNLLIGNFQGKTPLVKVSILHKSVKLIVENSDKDEERKRGLYVIVVGLVVFVLGACIIHQYFKQAALPILLITILGILYIFIGAILYKIFSYIRDALS